MSQEEKKKMLMKLTQSFYNIGYIGYYAGTQSQCASAAVALGIQGGSIQTLANNLSHTAWIAVAFIYTA